MQVEVHVVNAFIDGEEGGNPAGVVLDANRLSAAEKLLVAQRIGLSETAFVSSSTSATFKLEFFTPTKQIAHCGHATVAAFSLLKQLGKLSEGRHSKETIDGNRDIVIESDMAFMEQRAPHYKSLERTSKVYLDTLGALGLSEEQLLASVAPCVVNTGNSFLLVAVDSEATLANIRPNHEIIEAISEELDLIGYYPFSLETKRTNRHAAARMFAPRYGIPEEAGTGMAAGPLACFLHHALGVNCSSILIEQGWLMSPPSPSIITVTLALDERRVLSLMAGGRAKSMRTVCIEV